MANTREEMLDTPGFQRWLAEVLTAESSVEEIRAIYQFYLIGMNASQLKMFGKMFGASEAMEK